VFICVHLVNDQKPLLNLQVDLPGHETDSDVAAEESRINQTPLSELQKSDALILKVGFGLVIHLKNIFNTD